MLRCRSSATGFPAGLGLDELLDGGGVEECESRVNRGDFAFLFPDELAEEGDFEGVFLPGLCQLRVLLRQATQLAQYRVEREGRFIGVGWRKS